MPKQKKELQGWLPDKDARKLMAHRNYNMYVYRDGVVIRESRQIDLGANLSTTVYINHVWAAEIEFRSWGSYAEGEKRLDVCQVRVERSPYLWHGVKCVRTYMHDVSQTWQEKGLDCLSVTLIDPEGGEGYFLNISGRLGDVTASPLPYSIDHYGEKEPCRSIREWLVDGKRWNYNELVQVHGELPELAKVEDMSVDA